jgi:fructose-bisphosphate aldolase, class II
MKFCFAALCLSSAWSMTGAFVPASSSSTTTKNYKSPFAALKGGMSDDVGIPCEEDCAIDKYPNLPESIHPGVLSGKAMMDLLNHAKENGR